jgi:hypothetical protein
VWGKKKNPCRIVRRKVEGKRPLGRPRHRWENNIKYVFKNVIGGRGPYIRRVQDRAKWWTAVLWAGRSRVRIPTGTRDSLFHETVHTDSGTHSASSVSTGSKAPGA